MRYYISIEKNTEVFKLFRALWNELGVDGIRASSMTEGIQKAIEIEKSQTDELYFIDIVADDIDFMPQLKILSDETNAPILIATSKENDDEHHKALNNGADFYGRYCETPQQNINGVNAVINSIGRRMKKQGTSQTMIYKDLLVSPIHHQVFVKSTEIALTNKEFDILCYFMDNRGILLTRSKILNQVWGADSATPDVLWTHIKRIRKKLAGVSPYYENFIENVHGIGYRLNIE